MVNNLPDTSTFFLANRRGLKKVFIRLFYKPTDDTIDRPPSVYAAFPGNLTYDEVAHCTVSTPKGFGMEMPSIPAHQFRIKKKYIEVQALVLLG